MIRAVGIAALVSLATVLACGDENGTDIDGDDDAGESPSKDGGPKDAGPKDAGPKDAGRDSGRDGSTPRDAGRDASDEEDDAGDEDGGDELDGGTTDSGTDGGGTLPDAGEPDAAAPSTDVQISEVLADLPGDDGNREFIELRCTPGLALDPYWLVVADGDTITNQPNAVGTITLKKQLTGITCGASGFVVFQRATVYEGVAGTVYERDAFTSLQNGSQTYLLVKSDALLETDVDVDNDGVLDAAIAANVVDSVAVSDGTVGDATYSSAVLVGVEIDAISRFAGRTARASTSWYFGAVVGPSPYAYDPNEASANFPVGGTLSAGAENSAAP